METKIAGRMPALQTLPLRNPPAGPPRKPNSSTPRTPPPSKASSTRSNRRSSACSPTASRKPRATASSAKSTASSIRPSARIASSLITGRARQALPGVAKRVLNEWTSTVVAANHDRRSRQRAAERRVDIAGSSGAGNDGIRSMTPRNIDYARMSDSDILNL
jgi:hypothetical protein